MPYSVAGEVDAFRFYLITNGKSEQHIKNCIPAGYYSIGNKIYANCGYCGKPVQANKTFFGSLHICAPQEYRATVDAQRRAYGLPPLNRDM